MTLFNCLSDGSFMYLEVLMLMFVRNNNWCICSDNVNPGIWLCLIDPLRSTSFVPPTSLAFYGQWCLCNDGTIIHSLIEIKGSALLRQVVFTRRTCCKHPLSIRLTKLLVNVKWILNELKSILIKLNIPLTTQIGPTNVLFNMWMLCCLLTDQWQN